MAGVKPYSTNHVWLFIPGGYSGGAGQWRKAGKYRVHGRRSSPAKSLDAWCALFSGISER